MVAWFSECAVVSNWLPHTPVQIFFRLVLVHKTIWCSLSSSSIQTGVLAGTFYITLLYVQNWVNKLSMSEFKFLLEHLFPMLRTLWQCYFTSMLFPSIFIVSYIAILQFWTICFEIKTDKIYTQLCTSVYCHDIFNLVLINCPSECMPVPALAASATRQPWNVQIILLFTATSAIFQPQGCCTLQMFGSLWIVHRT